MDGRHARFVISGAAVAATLIGASGCALMRATAGAYDVGPNGIARSQERLREALARGDVRETFAWKEDDALLRQLNSGVSTYYASQFARSAAVLDSAALLSDDRITTSLSRSALALVTNDLARAYEPRRTERLFIPYYGMLAYARLEQWEDAAVEARRLCELLARYAADRTDAEKATHGALHYLAGAVFERAGERDEAQVAYRNARALLPALAESGIDRSTSDGEILIVVERGFVAHRATESVNVFIGESDRDSARGGPYRERQRRGDSDGDERDESGYWLSVALPALRHSHRVSGDAAIHVDGASGQTTHLVALVDDAAAADEQRERTTLLARAVARAAAKYVLTKAVKDKKGEVAGTMANLGASLLERADVRSWHLLPQELTLIRMRAPAGARNLQLSVGSGAGAERVDVGAVTVRARRTTIAAVRLWHEAPLVER